MPGVFAMLAGGAHCAVAQPGNGWSLPQLMHNLAQVRSASASFTERKTMRMLSAPLVAAGSLTYVAPGYVRKTTRSPIPEDFVLNHNQVSLSGGPDHQAHVFSLAQAPQLSGLVEGIRATLAGDLPTLQQFYNVRFSGTSTQWQLLLQPKNPALNRFIAWMCISGSKNRIEEIDTASANGDRSSMSVTETINAAK